MMKIPAKLPVFLAIGALVGSVGLASEASAHNGCSGGRGDFGARKLLRLMHDIDLTEEQELKAVRLRRQLRKMHKANRAAMRSDMDAMMSELEKPNPDSAVIRGTVERAMERMQKGAQQAVDAFLELHATLTPEQRAEVRERVGEIRERMERRQERRRGRSRGSKE